MEITHKHQLSDNAQKIIESLIQGSDVCVDPNDLKFHRIALKSMSAQFLTGDEVRYIEDRVKLIRLNDQNSSILIDERRND